MKILICNLHSALNLGDQAILYKTLEILKEKYPGATIQLLANHPKSWAVFPDVELFPSLINYIGSKKGIIRLVHTFNLVINLLWVYLNFDFLISRKIRVLLEPIINADRIYSCGGGNFYSNTFFASNLFLNALTIIIAGWRNKAIIMLPQSFGPFYKKFHLSILNYCLKFPQIIYTREKISFDILKQLKIPKEKIILMPDLALGITGYAKKEQPKNFNYDDINIGISIIDRGEQLRGFKSQENYINVIISTLENLMQKKNLNIYFIVQCYGPSPDQNDNLITTEVYNYFKNKSGQVFLRNKITTFSEVISEISQMDFIIASRMHTAIFGIITRVPTILIGYQPKAKGLFSMLNLENFYIPIDELSEKLLLLKSLDLLSHNHAMSETISTLLIDIDRDINNILPDAI